MKNIFHRRLDIPVKFVPVFPDKPPTMSKYDISLINTEFLDWLDSLQVNICNPELFYLKPNNKEILDKIPIHLDGEIFDNHVKLNFVYCRTLSTMNWLVCKDPDKLKYYRTPVGTSYIQADEEDCEVVYSAQIGQPSLVNVGMLHSVSAVQSERYCFSFPIEKDGRLILWEQAEEIFKDYVSLM